MARCRSCGADVIWATSTNGKAMPMDAQPDPKGTFVIVVGKARKATAEDDRLHRPRHTCHFATCEQADEWRRP